MRNCRLIGQLPYFCIVKRYVIINNIHIKRNSVDTLEKIVTSRELGTEPYVETIMDGGTLDTLLRLVRKIYLPDVVANYIARLVDSTHHGQSAAAAHIKYGASPRAALSLASAAKARALMNERTHASFEDVAYVAPSVLRHRILLDYNARVEGFTTNDVIQTLLKEVPAQNKATPKTLNKA